MSLQADTWRGCGSLFFTSQGSRAMAHPQGDLLAELRSSGVVTQLAWTEHGTLVEVWFTGVCSDECAHVSRVDCNATH